MRFHLDQVLNATLAWRSGLVHHVGLAGQCSLPHHSPSPVPPKMCVFGLKNVLLAKMIKFLNVQREGDLGIVPKKTHIYDISKNRV